MDPLDAFYQQLDSENLLKTHGPSLVDEAREVLGANSMAKVAGLITTPDSPEAAGVREMLARSTGQRPPPGLMVGLIPRPAIERLLVKQFGTGPWQEPSWQTQQVLPILVSTRDGHRFGLIGIGNASGGTSEM